MLMIYKFVLLVSFSVESLAYSYMVSCGTAMSNAGNRRYTAPGGGSPVLQRGSTALSCGSTLNANEQLSLTSSGTSGVLIHLTISMLNL